MAGYPGLARHQRSGERHRRPNAGGVRRPGCSRTYRGVEVPGREYPRRIAGRYAGGGTCAAVRASGAVQRGVAPPPGAQRGWSGEVAGALSEGAGKDPPVAEVTGGEAVVRTLLAHGVDVVFGLAGVHALPIYDALFAHPELRHISVRHEQTAAYMADGYSPVAGRPG